METIYQLLNGLFINISTRYKHEFYHKVFTFPQKSHWDNFFFLSKPYFVALYIAIYPIILKGINLPTFAVQLHV